MKYKVDPNSRSWSPPLWLKAGGSYLNMETDLCRENHLKGSMIFAQRMIKLWSSFPRQPCRKEPGETSTLGLFLISLFCLLLAFSIGQTQTETRSQGVTDIFILLNYLRHRIEKKKWLVFIWRDQQKISSTWVNLYLQDLLSKVVENKYRFPNNYFSQKINFFCYLIILAIGYIYIFISYKSHIYKCVLFTYMNQLPEIPLVSLEPM